MEQFKKHLKETGEIGYVEEVMQSIAYVSGLPKAMPSERVIFETGEFGEVLSLSAQRVEVLVFSKKSIRVGSRVARTNTFLDVPVGEELLGKTIDPLGNSLDPNVPFKKPSASRPIDVVPVGIQKRRRIGRSCETGITLVDLILPLGKGQRQLVIGDRKTGKTSFLLQTILTQARQGSICIYGAVGKKKHDIKKVEEFFATNNILQNTIIVASSSDDPVGVIYMTPYSAMTIAEYFRDQGKDVLVIFDDLSRHAKFYREISLLAQRFPGRNSYPGDIFYAHAKFLERAGNFIHENGKEVSITCIPTVETTQGDLSGYIQTNIMSMTDGHIYFDVDLFAKGRRPAINPFLSVTRVGRQTQTKVKRDINRELTSFLTLYEKMQNYIHFGAELSESVKNTIATGDKILSFFDQTPFGVLPTHLQVFLFCMLWVGVWQTKNASLMLLEMQKLVEAYRKEQDFVKDIETMIDSAESFNALLGQVRAKADEMLLRVGIVKTVQPTANVPLNPTVVPPAPAKVPVKPVVTTNQKSVPEKQVGTSTVQTKALRKTTTQKKQTV